MKRCRVNFNRQCSELEEGPFPRQCVLCDNHDGSHQFEFQQVVPTLSPKPRTPTEKIYSLIDTFPAVNGRRTNDLHGEFDLRKWQKFPGASTGEALIIQFIACVWSGGQTKEAGKFDLFDFVGRADSGNRKALMQWIANPVWP